MHKRLILSTFVILSVLTGCDNGSVPNETETAQNSAPFASVTAQDIEYILNKQAMGEVLNLDEEFVALSKDIAGFGGLFINEQGLLTVLVQAQHLSRVRPAVQGALAPVLERAPALAEAAGRGMVVEGSEYSFADLYVWKLRAHALLGIPGLSGIDADEVRNRVRIAVEDEAAAGRVREALTKLDIPVEAVFIQTGQRVAEAVKLTDHWVLVEGGFEIGVSQTGLCTLGFSAYRGGKLGFVTAAHCTTIYGAVDGTQVYQDSYGNGSEYIGYETVDPAFSYYGSGGGGPARQGGGLSPFVPSDDGMLHRKSDSAFIRSVTTGVNMPVIARTVSRSRTLGSITRSGAFRINDEARSYENVAGMELNKIGRTTGWTYGYIQGTCMTFSVQGNNRVLDCQYIVDAGVYDGDSGSPVFAWSGNGENVTLHGVLWGCLITDGSDDCPTTNQSFIYSPINGVESDLGALTTY